MEPVEVVKVVFNWVFAVFMVFVAIEFVAKIGIVVLSGIRTTWRRYFPDGFIAWQREEGPHVQ